MNMVVRRIRITRALVGRRIRASLDATRPGVAEFGVSLSIGILFAGAALGQLPR